MKRLILFHNIPSGPFHRAGARPKTTEVVHAFSRGGNQPGRLASDSFYFGTKNCHDSRDGWMAADPAGFVDGVNIYQFVVGNPPATLDPTGLAAATTQPTQANDSDPGALQDIAFTRGPTHTAGWDYYVTYYLSPKYLGYLSKQTVTTTYSVSRAGAPLGSVKQYVREWGYVYQVKNSAKVAAGDNVSDLENSQAAAEHFGKENLTACQVTVDAKFKTQIFKSLTGLFHQGATQIGPIPITDAMWAEGMQFKVLQFFDNNGKKSGAPLDYSQKVDIGAQGMATYLDIAGVGAPVITFQHEDKLSGKIVDGKVRFDSGSITFTLPTASQNLATKVDQKFGN